MATRTIVHDPSDYAIWKLEKEGKLTASTDVLGTYYWTPFRIDTAQKTLSQLKSTDNISYFVGL